MTHEPSVLIVSTRLDTATDAVVAALEQRGARYFRLNTEELPFSSTIAYNPAKDDDPWLTINDQTIPLPTSIWHRRVRAALPPDGMDEGIATFCRTETRAVIVGGMIGCPTRWMSHPANIWQAE